MTRVFYVMKKEFIQTFRDKRMVVMIFFVPLIQLFLFGYAVTTDVNNISLGVIDEDKSEISRRLVNSFISSGYFTFEKQITNDDEIKQFLYDGSIETALFIPADFSKKLLRGEETELQALFDASDSNLALIASGYTTQIVSSLSMKLLEDNASRINEFLYAMGKARQASFPKVEPDMRIWYNPELKSVYYMVPGVTCMILLIITMMLTGMAVIREKEIGTIEQIIVSPIEKWELILGKIAPFGILGMIDVTLIISAGVWHFNVPIRGSVILIFFSASLFLFTTLGLGLFFSTISKTQQQAMFVSFMFINPAILLSGFMFPIENMPDSIQYLTYLNPLRYFLKVIRGIFLKGNGFIELLPQLAALAVFGIIIFTMASAKFSKRLT